MSNISHAADWVGERRADNVSLAPGISEDWLSLIIGLAIFLLALAGLANVNLIGWVVTTAVWSNLGAALNTASATYRGLGGVGALVATYLALLAVLGAAALALKSDLKKFALAFTAVFFIAYASWIVGSYANFAAVTPAELQTLMDTPEAREIGLGDVSEARMSAAAATIAESFELPVVPKFTDVFNRSFLPPKAERMQPVLAN